MKAIHSSAAILAASLVASIFVATPTYNVDVLKSGGICLANASLLTQGTYQKSLTDYIVGWKDPQNYNDLLDYIAPPVEVARRFDYKAAKNSEALLSDPTEDLVGSDGNFKRILETSLEITAKTVNRGLTKRILKDDRVGNYRQNTIMALTARLNRNRLARAQLLQVAAATPTSINWGSSNTTRDPDGDMQALFLAAGASSGLSPNRIYLGRDNWALRSNAYRASSAPYAGAAARMTPDELGALWGLPPGGLRVTDTRIQRPADATKKIVAGAYVFAFYSQPVIDVNDASNFKRFWSACPASGQELAVHVEEHPGYDDITVECNELLAQTASEGVKSLVITNT